MRLSGSESRIGKFSTTRDCATCTSNTTMQPSRHSKQQMRFSDTTRHTCNLERVRAQSTHHTDAAASQHCGSSLHVWFPAFVAVLFAVFCAGSVHPAGEL